MWYVYRIDCVEGRPAVATEMARFDADTDDQARLNADRFYNLLCRAWWNRNRRGFVDTGAEQMPRDSVSALPIFHVTNQPR